MKKPKLTTDSFIQSYAEKAGLNRIKKTTGKKRIYYLCGAYTNDPHAHLKFALAEEILRREGHFPYNPTKRCPANMPWHEAIVSCLGVLNDLGELYRASLTFLGSGLDLPLPALMLIDPEGREIESVGVKLEKGIALANGLPIVAMGGTANWKETLENAIEELANVYTKGGEA